MDNELPNLEGGIPVLSQGQVLEFPSNAQVDVLEFPSNAQVDDSNAQVDETEDETVDDIVNGMDKLSIMDNAESALKEETEQTPQQEEVRRSMRTKTFPKRYDDFVTLDCELNFHAFDEPASFQEAVNSDVWKSAMQREYDALIKNGTWRLVNPPIGTKPIGCRWIYKNKYKADGSLDKHKARLVAKGYAQKEGVDYTETFAPTAKWGTIRTLFSLAAQKGWKIHHMDVKTAFLNGDLKEDVYMDQPEGFSIKGQEQKVCKLVKSLYGLKQAPRAWYEKLIEHLLKLNYKHFNLDDATLFVKKVGRSVVYLVVYVDDCLSHEIMTII